MNKLALAYRSKQKGKKYAEGGEVDAQKPLHSKPEDHNPEMEDAHMSAEMAEHELVDQDMPGQEDSSMDEEDLPHVAKSMSLAAEIMKDRKRQKMAEGGMVEEMDAPEEDGRDSRGLNLEPVHTVEDDEHDTSDASLVSEILKDRKSRRRG